VRKGIPISQRTVDDVDAAAARVEAAGGKLLMAPFDVMDAGRMTFVRDTTGAAIGLWQANQHIGATMNFDESTSWNRKDCAECSSSPEGYLSQQPAIRPGM
jgi:hypothetical protein